MGNLQGTRVNISQIVRRGMWMICSPRVMTVLRGGVERCRRWSIVDRRELVVLGRELSALSRIEGVTSMLCVLHAAVKAKSHQFGSIGRRLLGTLLDPFEPLGLFFSLLARFRKVCSPSRRFRLVRMAQEHGFSLVSDGNLWRLLSAVARASSQRTSAKKSETRVAHSFFSGLFLNLLQCLLKLFIDLEVLMDLLDSRLESLISSKTELSMRLVRKVETKGTPV